MDAWQFVKLNHSWPAFVVDPVQDDAPAARSTVVPTLTVEDSENMEVIAESAI